MPQEELDAMEISFKYHGFTWNQTNFAVAVIRSHVEPLRQQLDAANTLINKYREETTSLRQQVAAKQAEVDALMLEYCPSEMSQEQLNNWAAHQRPAERDEQAEVFRVEVESLRQHLIGSNTLIQTYREATTSLRQQVTLLSDFVTKISEQLPEKPDHWSSCSQCEHNASDAQDIIEELVATAAKEN